MFYYHYSFIFYSGKISIVLGLYRSYLAGALAHSFKALPGLNPVIGPMSSALANLSTRYIGVKKCSILELCFIMLTFFIA